jgi:hypothetical protein
MALLIKWVELENTCAAWAMRKKERKRGNIKRVGGGVFQISKVPIV